MKEILNQVQNDVEFRTDTPHMKEILNQVQNDDEFRTDTLL